MSRFKVSFALKQHTPIIHFQSEQKGATLRATELKPKFDRFLLEHVEGIPFKENANGHKSLEYKVNIIVNISDIQTERIEKINDRNGKDINDPLFFGNMKSKSMSTEEFEKIRKKFRIHNKIFKIEFFSFNAKVLEAIKNNFEAFLANTNFGTRQSKGFGNFYLADQANNKIKVFNKSLIPYKVYSFSSKENRYREDIKLLYSFLRQGINYPKGIESCPETRFYTKPAIFSYAKSKGWTWDKKAIKEEYFQSKLDNDVACRGNVDVLVYDSEDNYLLRDIFGLSSSQEWKSYGKTITKEGVSTERVDNKEVIKVQRFKSPITFKPILNGNGNMIIYFWANDTVNNIGNEKFDIKQNNHGDLTLSIPDYFNFNEFFEFAFNIKLATHINEKFHNTNEYKLLDRMFKEIKESK